MLEIQLQPLRNNVLVKSGKVRSYYETYFKRMVLLANEYLDDLELSQDAVQDIFVHLIQKESEVILNPEAYLFSATRHKCLDIIKTKKIRDSHNEKISYATENVYFERALENAELESYLMESIDQLPEKQRKILLESRMKGKPNSQIASEMNLSKRTVETQITNGLKRLRLKLSKYAQILLTFL